MKAFVALELPGAVSTRLDAALRPLRSRLPPARWVPVANWHLTLVFLGRVNAADLPALHASLASAFAGERAFEARLQGSGTFPVGRPARIVWIGVAPAEPLRRLQAAIAEASAACGFELERRGYSPHLTLARCRQPWPRAAIEAWSAACVATTIGEPAFEVRRGCLIESAPDPGGVHYEVVRSYALSPCKTNP